jgi:hypothetical protein
MLAAERYKEASQTRDYRVANKATHRAARPDPSLHNPRLLGMTGRRKFGREHKSQPGARSFGE